MSLEIFWRYIVCVQLSHEIVSSCLTYVLNYHMTKKFGIGDLMQSRKKEEKEEQESDEREKAWLEGYRERGKGEGSREKAWRNQEKSRREREKGGDGNL